MNIEICKKCKNCDKETIWWKIIRYVGDRDSVIMIYFQLGIVHGICIKHIAIDRSIPSILHSKQNPSEYFDKVRLSNKDCPYYLEHCLHEWSKE